MRDGSGHQALPGRQLPAAGRWDGPALKPNCPLRVVSSTLRTQGLEMSEQQTLRLFGLVFGTLVLGLFILNAAAMP